MEKKSVPALLCPHCEAEIEWLHCEDIPLSKLPSSKGGQPFAKVPVYSCFNCRKVLGMVGNMSQSSYIGSINIKPDGSILTRPVSNPGSSKLWMIATFAAIAVALAVIFYAVSAGLIWGPK